MNEMKKKKTAHEQTIHTHTSCKLRKISNFSAKKCYQLTAKKSRKRKNVRKKDKVMEWPCHFELPHSDNNTHTHQ